MYDSIIIGAGPAGLTSALYLLRANKKVLVLEQATYGGQIINADKIENYPGIEEISGFDFATNLYNQVIKLGCEIKYEKVLKIHEDKKVETSNNLYSGKTIIIATGCSNKKLDIENESKLIGKGISYCATCDGNFYKNKNVALIGGGNTAIDEALYLSNICKKVYLIYRNNTLKAEEININEVKQKDNIEIIYNSIIKKINGNEILESIDIINKENEETKIYLDGLFVAIGKEPNNEIFNNVVELDSKGYIKTTNDVLTKTSGIYAVGDTRVKELRQITTAVSDGSIAASMAVKEIKKSIES